MIAANCTALKTDCFVKVLTSSVTGERVYPDFAAVYRISRSRLTLATDQLLFPIRR